MSPIKYANDHPWIYVVLAFLLLIAAWTTFIILAVKNRPDPLPEQGRAGRTEPPPLHCNDPGKAEPQRDPNNQTHTKRFS